MYGIAAEHHITCLRQLDEQAVMARRVPRRAEHDHGAVAKHVLVEGERFDLPSPLIQLSNG